jgi:hypothetical protein
MSQVELQPPPGVDLIDRMCIAADQRERQQARAPDRTEQMTAACTLMLQQQTQIIAALAELVMRKEAKAKRKSRQR